MKSRFALCFFAVAVLTAVVATQAQNKAAVQMENLKPLRAGDTITFMLRLNEPMPKGAHFDFRISPVGADEEVALGSGEPVNGSDTDFKVSGKLPENALPGEWHISIIWLFLPGAGWTHNTISPNDLRFHVEGNPYPIPTKAQVTLGQ